MARIGRQVSLIAAVWLASSAVIALAQTGGSSSGGAGGGTAGGTGGTAGSTSVGPSGAGTTGSITPSAPSRIGPGGVPMAPGPSGANTPSQRIGPGGVPMAPGPAGDLSGGIPGAETSTAGSGRPCPGEGTSRALGPPASALGPPAPIIADEPGRRGQATGADATTTAGTGITTGTTGAGTTTGAGDTAASTTAMARGC